MKYLLFFSCSISFIISKGQPKFDTIWSINNIRCGNERYKCDSNETIIGHKFIDWHDGSESGEYYQVKTYDLEPHGTFYGYDTLYFTFYGNKVMVIDSVIKRTWYFKARAYKAVWDTCGSEEGPCSTRGIFFMNNDSVEVADRCGVRKYSNKDYDDWVRVRDSLTNLIPLVDTSGSENIVVDSKYYYINSRYKPYKRFFPTSEQRQRMKFIDTNPKFFDPIYRKKHPLDRAFFITC